MSATYTGPLDRIAEGLDELAVISPAFRTTGEKRELLVGLSRLIARAEAERLRVLAAADDIAEETGDRSTAAWLAQTTREAGGTTRRHARLAVALGARWTQVAEALAAGIVNLAQARVMVEALDALPADLGDDLCCKAEAHLVAEAAHYGPRELRILGGKVLEVIAPDVADDAEYQRLLAAERRAGAATTLAFRRRGDGSVDIHARVPDHVAGRLLAYLNAYTAPRRHHHWTSTEAAGGAASTPSAPDEFADLPLSRQRGEALVALLENIPTDQLPRHGGLATTLTVTLDYDTLLERTGPGVAETSTGDRVTAGVARRLACQAGIVPVVLGGRSEVLDVGRTRRLVTDGIRKALNLRDQRCTETGCTMPAAFCEAHHTKPWSHGGKTSLEDSKLLCSFHHHRAHDPGWITHHHPNGTTTFTRRT